MGTKRSKGCGTGVRKARKEWEGKGPAEMKTKASDECFLKSSVPALPKISVLTITPRTQHLAPDFGDLSSQMPDKFNAQKSFINHYMKPVA